MSARNAAGMELGLVRLHAGDGEDLGTVGLPDGWILAVGDLLATESETADVVVSSEHVPD